MPMNLSIILRFALAIVFAGALGSAAAQDAPKTATRGDQRRAARTGQGRAAAAAGRLRSPNIRSIHRSGKLAYTATAGTLAFYDQSGEQSAVGVLHRLCRQERRAPTGPLTFVFNGGPGAASAFLHLGLVGPRMLDFGPDGHDAARATCATIPTPGSPSPTWC